MGNEKGDMNMRVRLLLATVVVLAGCNSGSDTQSSTIYGVYSGRYVNQLFTIPQPPPTIRHLAGAVAPDGHGYFVFTGTPPSPIVMYSNLWQPGFDAAVVLNNVTPGGYNSQSDPFPVAIETLPGGTYRITYGFSYGDGHVTETYDYQASTGQAKSFSQLAGDYQGTDVARNTFTTAKLDAMGKFTGTQANGCHFSGLLTQVDTKNLYTVDLDFTGGAGCQVELRGVAWVGDADLSGQSTAPGTFLNLIAVSDDRTDGVGMTLQLQ